jgi:internalin A
MSDRVHILIAENKGTRATSLDLSTCELDALPPELAELHWLEGLTLPGADGWVAHEQWDVESGQARELKSRHAAKHRWSYSPLAALPRLQSMRLSADDVSDIGVVAGLTSLTLRNGKVPDLVELAKLRKLRELRLYEVEVSHPHTLRQLRQLEALVLHRCSQNLLPAVFALTQLRALDISWMISGIRAGGGNEELDLSPLRGLLALQTLLLTGAHVVDLAGLRDLRSLLELDVSHTSVSDLGPLRNLTAIRKLDLSETRATDISPLSDLTALQALKAENARIGDLAPLRHLRALQDIDISRTYVSDLSPLSELTELQRLNASNTSVTSLAPLRNLRALWALDVSRTLISDLSGLQNLTGLRYLDISRTEVRDLAPLMGVTELNTLNASNTHVEDLDPLRSLTSLRTLNVARTNVADLAAVCDLSALQTLNVWRTGISDLSPLRELRQLRALNASDTRVSDLMPLRRRIEEGVRVEWSDNYDPPGIFVHNCPLTSPPAEIVERGADAIINYFLERDRGAIDHLYEAKLLIVGDGGAGKTSLVRRLYQPGRSLPNEGETTKGINIHRHDFTLKNGSRFRLNIWDFGGQEIYHATHQFFLTRRSLYVLVDDTRTSDKSVSDPRFKYWLDLIDFFGDGSPTLIFQNEKGGRTKQIDLAGIRGEYESVKDRHGGNLEHPSSVESLRDAIEYFAGTLDHVGDELPASWLKVRADIEARAQECPYIPQHEYFAIYSRHMEFDRARALHLSRYLHDLGVFLHFQDDALLSRIVILQNHWATEAVFRVLDDEIVKAQRGRFTRADCSRLWHDAHYADMHPELLALMQSFELCYELPDCQPSAWLAPQMLSPGKPSVLSDWARTDDLVLGYHYEFLPKGIISRLTVRLNRFVRDPQKAWVTGVLFERENTSALVELLASGKDIQLRARGPDRKALLSVIAADLDALNASFEGLRGRVSKRIPCVCSRCREAPSPELFDERQLMRRKENGRLKVECPASYEEVSVVEMLDGFRASGPVANWTTPEVSAAPATIRVFLASSAELRADRDAFDLYFRQLNDRLLTKGFYLEIVRWENFLDAMSETRLQNEYNKALAACDVFVSLFFTKTGKFTEEEFDVAHRQFKAAGKPAIYTFFKNAEIRTGDAPASDLQCLWAFQEKLRQLGHFYTMYDNIEHLKRQFRDQLDRLMVARGFR